MEMEAWISSVGRAPFQWTFSRQRSAGLRSVRLICNRSAPILFSRGKRKMTHISTLPPMLFGIAHYHQSVTFFMDSMCVYHWWIHSIFYSWILLCWWSAENLPRGHPLSHGLKATKLACNRKRKPFQNMAPTLIRLVAAGIQKSPVSSQTSHLWARGHCHAVSEVEKWKECKFVPFRHSPEK